MFPLVCVGGGGLGCQLVLNLLVVLQPILLSVLGREWLHFDRSAYMVFIIWISVVNFVASNIINFIFIIFVGKTVKALKILRDAAKKLFFFMARPQIGGKGRATNKKELF